jgi:hypothetical protein
MSLTRTSRCALIPLRSPSPFDVLTRCSPTDLPRGADGARVGAHSGGDDAGCYLLSFCSSHRQRWSLHVCPPPLPSSQASTDTHPGQSRWNGCSSFVRFPFSSFPLNRWLTSPPVTVPPSCSVSPPRSPAAKTSPSPLLPDKTAPSLPKSSTSLSLPA